jgi:hypothetical protein
MLLKDTAVFVNCNSHLTHQMDVNLLCFDQAHFTREVPSVVKQDFEDLFSFDLSFSDCDFADSWIFSMVSN